MLVAFSWAASFVLIYKGLSLAAPLVLVACQALVGALVLAGIGLSTRGVAGFKNKAAEAWQKMGYWPVVALVGFYFLQVTRRYTEQAGADVIFVLGLAPAIVLLVSARNLSKGRALAGAVGMSVAILGAVGVLANWERPSSFSPFVIFLKEELLLLGAAACWAAFIVLVKDKLEESDTLVSAAVVLGVTALALVAAALVREGPAAFVLDRSSLRLVVMLGVFGAALGCYSWLALAKAAPTPVEAASAVLVAPALLSLLIFIDQAQGLTGPNPMIQRPVLLGSLLTLLGAAGVWTAGWWEDARNHANGLLQSVRSPLNLAVALSGAAGLVAAVVALALPVQRSTIEGEAGQGVPYAARWATAGVEAVGAWLAFLAAVVIALLVFQALRGRLDGVRLAAGASVAVALLAGAPHLSDSLFVAWKSWIPAEVQHAIGTPYATLEQSPVPNPAFVAVDVAVAIAVALMIVKILWRKQKAS